MTKMSENSTDEDAKEGWEGGYCITADDVERAYARIKDTVHKTPVLTSTTIMTQVDGDDNDEQHRCYDDGKRYFFKCEAMQKTGSFKFRGALNAIRSEIEERMTTMDQQQEGEDQQRSPSNATLRLHCVTHSSGNHAQALALASKLSSSSNPSTEAVPVPKKIKLESTTTTPNMVDVQATIVMPNNAPQVKKQAVKSYGATIVEVLPTNEARQQEADRIIQQHNQQQDEHNNAAIFIHPSENPRVIAGQGTVSIEFIDQLKQMDNGLKLDVVIIPVGGGGLASGNIMFLRSVYGPDIKIVLAEPETLDDAKRSFESKKLQRYHDPSNLPLNSVADGLKTTLGPNTWPIIRDMVDDIMTVSEYNILRCTKLVWERLKVTIEPSAGVGVAVAQSKEFNTKYPKSKGYHNVGIILCGGNVDIVQTSMKMKEMGL